MDPRCGVIVEKVLCVKIDEELYRDLEKLAHREGFMLVSDFVRSLIVEAVGGRPAGRTALDQRTITSLVEKILSDKLGAVIERLVKVIDRRVQDLVNPYTSRIDEIARRTADVIERLEALEQKLHEVEQKVRTAERPYQAYRSEFREERRERRRSAIEILREQGVIFESEIARRIKDRDTFFSKLEREGAKILDLQGERIAVDSVFWENFIEKLSSIDTSNDDEIKKMLAPLEYKLFTRLRESALIYFDATQRRWNFVGEA